MAILSRDAILGSDDLKKEVVSVPEWGGEVVIATMTGVRVMLGSRVCSQTRKQFLLKTSAHV